MLEEQKTKSGITDGIFKDLPTGKVLLTDEERYIIGSMRKCKRAKTEVAQILRGHHQCDSSMCNVDLNLGKCENIN